MHISWDPANESNRSRRPHLSVQIPIAMEEENGKTPVIVNSPFPSLTFQPPYSPAAANFCSATTSAAFSLHQRIQSHGSTCTLRL